MAVGQLTVNVVAKTGRASRNLKSFRGDVRRAGSDAKLAGVSFRRAGSAVRSMTGPLLAAGAAALSFRAFNSAAADLDRLAKKSRMLGMTATELAGLRHAAEQTAGVTGGTLDMAMQRMTRRVSEAGKGTGEAKAAIAELGLDAKKLAAQSPAKTFREIADAIQGAGSDGDKLRLAFKLFDSEGAALVNTLNEGSGALKKFEAEAVRLGLAFDDEKLAKVEAYNDAMDRLAKATGSLGTSIVVEAAPGLTEAANAMTEAVQGFKSFKAPTWLTGGAKQAASFADAITLGGLRRSAARTMFDDGDKAGQLTGDEALRVNQIAGRYRERTRPKTSGDLRQIHERRRRARVKREFGQGLDSGTVGAAKGFLSSVAKKIGETGSEARTKFQDFNREASRRAARGLNPLTGLAPTGKSDARRKLEAQRSGLLDGSEGARPLNRLIDANSAEGYQALRANQRQGGPEETAKKTSEHTKKTAAAAEQTAAQIKRLVGLLTRQPAPASA